jgi:hypothetical protein
MYACGRYGPEIGLDARSGYDRVATRTHPERNPNGTRLDQYGNEVEPAVSDYRLDRQGELYERHSPDTLVGGLGVPST